MKTKIKNYWVLVALIVFVNIAIFMFFSKKLESFVINYTVTVQTKNGM